MMRQQGGGLGSVRGEQAVQSFTGRCGVQQFLMMEDECECRGRGPNYRARRQRGAGHIVKATTFAARLPFAHFQLGKRQIGELAHPRWGAAILANIDIVPQARRFLVGGDAHARQAAIGTHPDEQLDFTRVAVRCMRFYDQCGRLCAQSRAVHPPAVAQS